MQTVCAMYDNTQTGQERSCHADTVAVVAMPAGVWLSKAEVEVEAEVVHGMSVRQLSG